MSQRWSEYARQPFDLYETPEWATKAVVPFLPQNATILEPACGGGKMVRALQACGFNVCGQDIQTGRDFFDTKACDADAIVTNPPFKLATNFIEHSLKLVRPQHGTVAMLLRTDFDHAKTRRHLFDGNSAFSMKIVLTKRIIWFERQGAAPSFNHAWYLWNWKHTGAPIIAWDFQ
jgi:hypothetical protein